MEWSGLALFGCLCALVALANSAAVPAKDTLVISRFARAVTESPEASSTAAAVEEPVTEGPTPPVKMSEMTVRSEVSLRYAHTSVVTKVRNPAKRAQEANFRVLLPETAFISGFVMILDGKPYKAYVKEKEEAKKIYTDAVESGFAAAHISAKARDSNHFTVSVNVEPNTTAVFNLTYEELLVRRNNVYNHAINLHPGVLVPKLTVTVHIKEAQKITALRVPEMRTGNEIDATEDDAQNSMAVISRGHDDREATITFSPDLDQQKNLMLLYMEKTKNSQSSSYRSWRSEEQTAEQGVLGQFVVQYDVDRPKEGEILVNDGYFVHFFAPSDLPPLSKQVVFVLDTSGSMMGTKVKQLIEAMRTILGELNQGDYFSIVEFASSVKVHDLRDADKEPAKQTGYSRPWDEKPTYLIPPSPATAGNIERAKVLVGQLTANGGTNIEKALDVAVHLIQRGIGWEPTLENGTKVARTKYVPDFEHEEAEEVMPVAEASTATTTSQPPATTSTTVAPAAADTDESKKLEPIIIFLTDGDPTVGETRPARIINRLVEKNTGRNKAAIFSLAFGEDADRDLLRKLSLRNDGFMRHIYEAADAALQLRDFYRQVSSPLLADVHFNYPKHQIKEGSLTKNKFRTYYSGSETVVAGKLASDVTELTPKIEAFCGVDDHNKRKKYEISPMVPVSRPAGEYLPLERLWAYLTIKQLLDEKDKTDAPTDNEKEDSPEKKALEIALKYEFVTPLTSLVVVKPNATSAVDAESVDKQHDDFESPVLADSLILASPVASYHKYQTSLPLANRGGPYVGAAALMYSPPRPQAFAASAGAGAPQGFESEDEEYDLIDSAIPDVESEMAVVASSTPRLPQPTEAVTSPAPATSALQTFHLENFQWVLDALKANDSISFENVTLDLVRDTNAPKEASDAECQKATDGGAGVCVYLTRCDAAKSITLDSYKTTFCRVDNHYAGVCCPKAQVDVIPSSGS
ncbi:hypothetical protein O0L34_g12300 [Tuta absoluta]|nr:hypothetical protein O0L34_g12300 [Tuta absoluta]